MKRPLVVGRLEAPQPFDRATAADLLGALVDAQPRVGIASSPSRTLRPRSLVPAARELSLARPLIGLVGASFVAVAVFAPGQYARSPRETAPEQEPKIPEPTSADLRLTEPEPSQPRAMTLQGGPKVAQTQVTRDLPKTPSNPRRRTVHTTATIKPPPPERASKALAALELSASPAQPTQLAEVSLEAPGPPEPPPTANILARGVGSEAVLGLGRRRPEQPSPPGAYTSEEASKHLSRAASPPLPRGR